MLTSDRALREAAQAEGVDIHGLLWLCDRMNDQKTVSKAELLNALIKLDADPSAWLPSREIRKRIEQLRAARL